MVRGDTSLGHISPPLNRRGHAHQADTLDHSIDFIEIEMLQLSVPECRHLGLSGIREPTIEEWREAAFLLLVLGGLLGGIDLDIHGINLLLVRLEKLGLGFGVEGLGFRTYMASIFFWYASRSWV